jgi:hypothetical protein
MRTYLQLKLLRLSERIKVVFTIRRIAYGAIFVAVLSTLWYLIVGGLLYGSPLSFDSKKIIDLRLFATGITVPLLTFGSLLLVLENLWASTDQNFYNNFFKLIDQNKKILEGVNSDTIGLKNIAIKSKGKDFFDELAGKISFEYDAVSTNNRTKLRKADRSLIIKATGKEGRDLLLVIYDHHFHIYQSDLGHYFRNLFHIVRFVHNSRISDRNKLDAIRILRSQLSNYEILLLAYNGMHFYGKEFKPLIDTYELLKNLNNEKNLPEDYVKRIIPITILMSEYEHLNAIWSQEQF